METPIPEEKVPEVATPPRSAIEEFRRGFASRIEPQVSDRWTYGPGASHDLFARGYLPDED